MELNDEYVVAVDVAMSKAGVYERSAFAVASRIFQDSPALAALVAYVEGLKTQLPTHFAPAPAAPAVEVPEVREAVRQAHFHANLATIAGPETPAPAKSEAPAPPKTISRTDPEFPRLFARHAKEIASGACVQTE